MLYTLGKGVPQNPDEAVKWVEMAAEQGNVKAQNMLGAIYFEGLFGVPKNRIKAYKWLMISSAQGDKLAIESRDKLKKEMTPGEIAGAEEVVKEFYEGATDGADGKSGR